MSSPERLALTTLLALLLSVSPVLAQDTVLGQDAAPPVEDETPALAAEEPTPEPALEPLAEPPPEPIPEPEPALEPIPEPEPALAATPVPPPPPVVPAAPQGLSIGEVLVIPQLQVRPRGELRIDPVGASITDQYFVTSRIRLGLDVRWQVLRGLVQMQDSRFMGQFPAGTDGGDTLGVHQGFFEVGGDIGYVRVGRQEYALGGERFVGPLNWTSSARSFDAVRGHLVLGNLELDAVAAWVRWHRMISYVDPMTTMPGTVESEGDYLGVLAATWNVGPALRLEPYVLYRHDGPTEPAQGSTNPMPQVQRHRDIAHFGGRASGADGILRYEAEGAIQAGVVGGRDHLAFALLGHVWLTLGSDAGITLMTGASYGSGASPDGSVDELDNFYPTNHLFYGYADYFGLRNLIDARLRVASAPVSSNLQITLDGHLYVMPEPGARWSDAVGNTIAVNAMNREQLTGGEVDLELRWNPIQHFSVWTAYALFIPGPAAESLGQGHVSHWAYLMLDLQLP